MNFRTLFVIGCLALAIVAVPLHACDYALPRQSSVTIYGAAAAPAAAPDCPSCAPAATYAAPAASAVLRVERALTVVEAPRAVEVQRVYVPAPAPAPAAVVYQQSRQFTRVAYGSYSRASFAVVIAPVARQRLLAPRPVVVRDVPAVVVRQPVKVVKAPVRAVKVAAPAAQVEVIQKRGLFGRNVTKVRVR